MVDILPKSQNNGRHPPEAAHTSLTPSGRYCNISFNIYKYLNLGCIILTELKDVGG